LAWAARAPHFAQAFSMPIWFVGLVVISENLAS
jgi:hypothetical protein